MITKVIGAGLIVGVTGWAGLQKGSILSRRTNALRQLRTDLEFLEKEISYARIPLIPALEKTAAISKDPVCELFQQTAYALKDDRAVTAREAWEAGLSSFQHGGILIKEDLDIVGLIGERLGTSDAADQIKMLRLVIEELKIQEEKSRLRETAEKRLWGYGGFLAGLMICILII